MWAGTVAVVLWGAGQMVMSALWSVRERAFSRKLSLIDSICSRGVRGKGTGGLGGVGGGVKVRQGEGKKNIFTVRKSGEGEAVTL